MKVLKEARSGCRQRRTDRVGLAACGGGGAGGAVTGAPAPGGPTKAPADLKVGVAMPNQTSERWIADGNSVKEQLEDEGYSVELQYAGDDIPTQSQQVDQMITQGVDALIIAAIDGTALSSQLQAAADAGIPVISYDRLIRDSENVDFYVSFDNFAVGVAQANALLTGLGVKNDDAPDGTATGPFNIELFAGSLDDNNAHFFFDGAMSILQPLIDDGTLVVKSGQTDIEQVAILAGSRRPRRSAWRTSSPQLQRRLEGQRRPVALRRSVPRHHHRAAERRLRPDDSTPPSPMPIVTGQDAEIASVKLIADGVQSSTIFKDTRLLAEQAVFAGQGVPRGRRAGGNDTMTYDNGSEGRSRPTCCRRHGLKDDIQQS
jgi:putative multiple sugar transport system substrate-binding protein